jgi:hypothetical protein
VDELAASRRRVWFGMIMVVTFGLLIIGALLPTPSPSLRVDQASADETVPTPTAIEATDIAQVTPVTDAPTPVTVAVTTTEAPTTSTTAAPKTTTTTAAKATSSAVQAAVPAPVAPTPPPTVPASASAFLACIRNRESHGDYGAVSASGTYRGAYQFSQGAWDSTASHAGRSDLVGRQANTVAPADQDAIAFALYQWQGSAPWGGACA